MQSSFFFFSFVVFVFVHVCPVIDCSIFGVGSGDGVDYLWC